MEGTVHKKRQNNRGLLYLVILGIIGIVAVLLFFQTRQLPNKQQVLQIRPANQPSSNNSKSRLFFVNVPDVLEQQSRPNIRINQWTFVEKNTGLQINLIVLPYSIDYAKKSYSQLQFYDYSNTSIRGWHAAENDTYDIYILDKDIATRVWITANISKISDKPAARKLTEQLAQSVRFKN